MEKNQQATAGGNGRRKISFANVIIREYNLTIGDHPCCRYGPPTTLDWEYEEVHDSRLEEYEATRVPRRKYNQLTLSHIARKDILIGVAGFTDEDVKKAIRRKDFCRFQRKVTKIFSSVWRLEDALESLSRKVSRALKPVARMVERQDKRGDYHRQSTLEESTNFFYECISSTPEERYEL